MSTTSYKVPEPLVDTRVRIYAESMSTLCQQSHSRPVCEGRSTMLEGTPVASVHCCAALAVCRGTVSCIQRDSCSCQAASAHCASHANDLAR
ncbi:hypothetical protein OKW42_006312 [Paraburkholderia sp. WC7.3d]